MLVEAAARKAKADGGTCAGTYAVGSEQTSDQTSDQKDDCGQKIDQQEKPSGTEGISQNDEDQGQGSKMQAIGLLHLLEG